jgi:hypothetical protein
LGSGEAVPIVFHWRWYHHLPSLGLTALIGLLLLLSRSVRTRELWLAVSAVLAFVLWQMEGFSVLVGAVALLWVVMSMRAPRSSKRRGTMGELPMDSEGGDRAVVRP